MSRWCYFVLLVLTITRSFAADFTVNKRTIEDWRPFEGRVESRAVENIIAPASGRNLVMDIVEEGQSVTQGEVVVRFAVDQLEESRARIESDLAVAKAAFSEAKDGRHPLDRAMIERDIENAELDWNRFNAEAKELSEIKELGLVSQSEVDKAILQRDAAGRLKQSKTRELNLTIKTLQPAELRRLSAAVERSETEIAQINYQIEQSVIKAAQDGVAVLLPIFIAGQQRTARAGDELNQGRAFMQIVDVSDIHIRLEIEESQSAGVTVGKKVKVYPVADRNQFVYGMVAKKGRVAKSSSNGKGRTIDALINVETSLDLLVPGASVEAQILVDAADDIIAIPRGAVRWQKGEPTVDQSGQLRPIELGLTDALWVEVTSGLSVGDVIQTP